MTGNPNGATKIAEHHIALDAIEIEDGWPIDHAKVEAIARSFADTGFQINAVVVRPVRARREGAYVERWRLVAGRHRVLAAQLAGWSTIRAVKRNHNTDAARLGNELIEIDENLCRRDLTPAARALLTVRRKRIYEALHPETRHGGDRKSSRHDGDTPARFTAATASASGKAERTVQRDAARGEALGEAVLERVAGTSLDEGAELDALARLDPSARDEVIERARAGEKINVKAAAKKAVRAARERELGAKQTSLPDRRYGVIYADPEWNHEAWSDSGMLRAASNHYPTSSLAEIKARPVGEIAAPDCALFLWSTVPHLPQALEVMAAWGFAYRSQIVWVKDYPGAKQGLGYWFRINHEILLVGTRGKIPSPAPGENAGSVITAPPGRHSQKPAAFAELIEAYFPSLPKIELNARAPRAGWDVWGNEVAP